MLDDAVALRLKELQYTLSVQFKRPARDTAVTYMRPFMATTVRRSPDEPDFRDSEPSGQP